METEREERKEQLITANPKETLALGERLAQELNPGDCVALVGELGAGKTTLIKGLARGLGVPEEEVISPTFMLIREHRGGRVPLFHVDAYRISDPDELREIGIEEYLLSGEGITVIEWAERVEGLLPPGCIRIELEVLSATERRITITRPSGAPTPR